ncbi:MAG: nucleotidyltransferase domain-containing protein [Nitrospirae bacterium]|nr:nucleotidyltransferase domain-containing protein [Nitrospirota bacterium]
MSLTVVLKERWKKRKAIREDALNEAGRLALLLRKQYTFDALYVCGSLVSGSFGKHSDIDLIIKGLKTEDFFRAYAYLLKESRYGIDLKPFEDLHEDFKERVLAEGIMIE